MLLSIVVLSYNRPEQVDRILCNLLSASSSEFNLIIKDDCSPRQSEIESIVESYAKKARFEIVLYKNKSNLGYDRNLLDAFAITESDYIFLLSDDDYINGARLIDLIKLLSRREYKIYFTPYQDRGGACRSGIRPYELARFDEVIYNSILFSGLIFYRKSVLRLPRDEGFLSSSIYTQVYLASVLIFNEKEFGYAPNDLLHLGGDGENFFGKNESAINGEGLRDRSCITSNLRYQMLLLAVVYKVGEATSMSVINIFMIEYNRRLISYLFRARSLGLIKFNMLVNAIEEAGINVAWYIKPLTRILPLVPSFLANTIVQYAVKILKRAG
jgi:glycosyltransferase involved in cell wall biosynthesis